jgi:PhnB protein
MLNTYLNFDGNCREAFEFYRSVFGGDFSILQTFGDGPEDMNIPENEMNNVMHVSLPVGGSVLMGSDMPSTFGNTPIAGNNFSISASPGSREDADRLFGSLSDGGTVTMPMREMFWGSYFGTCTDKFGINWMVGVGQSPE